MFGAFKLKLGIFMQTIEDRQSHRVGFGLVPALYDKVTVLYPDTVTEVCVYELSDANGNYSVVGYVEVVYTDTTKRSVLTMKRLAT
jgi:hypothetical protein